MNNQAWLKINTPTFYNIKPINGLKYSAIDFSLPVMIFLCENESIHSKPIKK